MMKNIKCNTKVAKRNAKVVGNRINVKIKRSGRVDEVDAVDVVDVVDVVDKEKL